MVWTAESASVAPGIWTRIELLPWICTVASEAPSVFTRFSTMVLALFISSAVGAEPSCLEAVRITETPPWMSRPVVMRSPSGVKQNAHAKQTTAVTTSVET